MIVPVLTVGVLLTPSAFAGCGDVSQMQGPFVFPQLSKPATQVASVTARDQTSSAALYSGGAFNTATIVGFWKSTWLSMGNMTHNPPIPDGAEIDYGYGQWHNDGTEIFNSGGHSPASGNICFGTWVRTGFFTYELTHYALSFNTTGALSNKVVILEAVTLDPSGNEYSGTFTITIYDLNDNPVDHVTGTLSSTRITVDQTTTP